MILSNAPPSAPPSLAFLLGGFGVLAVGLAALGRRRPTGPIASAEGTRRALLYLLVYGACVACFARLLSPALLGREHSPWLLALGDVTFVTLGLFVWVMVLAEGRPWREYGFHGTAPARMLLVMTLGLGAAAYFGLYWYRKAWAAGTITPDGLVFALLFAAIGSALPEEVLVRGYLQGSLAGRANRWARLAFPAAAFALLRAVRYLPGTELSVADWLFYVVGVSIPLGLWWGLMRDLAGGSLWPSLVSHFLLAFGRALASASEGAPPALP